MSARRKEYMVKVELSDVELNYIDSALGKSITEHEFEIFRWGKNHGNIASLLRKCKQVRSRLRNLHTASYRERMGEVKWKEHRKFVNAQIKKMKAGRG